MPSEPVGASVWETDLYEHLTSHEDKEMDLLVSYQQVAEEAGAPAFTYLVSLIGEDEARHHKLFRDLASALRTDAELGGEEPTVPRLNGWGPDPGRVVDVSERLIELERSDLKELRRLERELDDVKDTTLWSLIVRIMQADTEKHIAILDFVRRHAARRS